MKTANVAAKRNLTAARMDVYDKCPFFSAVLYSLVMIEEEGLDTFAVDGKLRMYFDPDRAAEWGRSGVAAVLFHEIGHVLREHHQRAEALRPQVADRYEKVAGALASIGIDSIGKLFNFGGDMEINDDIEKVGFQFPKGIKPVTPSSLNAPGGKSMEFYVDHILKLAENGQTKTVRAVGSGIPGCGGSCGSCAGNKVGPEQDPEDTSQIKIARVSVAHAIQERVKEFGIGSVPGNLAVWASKQLEPPKIDWKKRLRSSIRSAIATIGSNDYTSARRSRRSESVSSSFGQQVALPSLIGYSPKMAVAIDTSGSMGGRRLELAASEAIGIAKAMRIPVSMFSVDAAVQAEVKVSKSSQLSGLLKGGGGTDMRIAVHHASKRGFNLLVLITDGETAWPKPSEMPRGLRVIVCCVSEAIVPSHVGSTVRVS